MTATDTLSASETAGALATRPELMAAVATMLGTIKRNRILPERLVELMRLRVAFRNQCRTCMSLRYADALADGITEGLVCSLEKPEEAADMSAAEKAAVAYADRFAVDHLAIDEQKARLFQHFSAGEVAEIAVTVACFVGFGRLAAVFDAGNTLPVGEARADGSPMTPWGIAEPLVAQ